MTLRNDADRQPEGGGQNVPALIGMNGRDVFPGTASLTEQDEASGGQTEYDIERDAAGQS